MSAPTKMRIASTDGLLRWLDTGRKLARNVLRNAGASAALIRAIGEKPMSWYRAPNRSTLTDPKSGEKIRFTEEMAAAVQMLDVCDSLAIKVRDPATPAHLLVLEGYNLSLYEDAMKAAHWAAEAKRKENRERAAKKRTPRPPAAMVRQARSAGVTWAKFKRQLPKRIDGVAYVMGYAVSLAEDGRFVITHNKKSSRPIDAKSLREYFNRD